MDAPATETPSSETILIEGLIDRARAAQSAFEQGADQARYDQAALAVGWAIMQPERNVEMATLAVETTGLGNARDKITKNHRKTLGLLRDIRGQVTHGVVSDDPATGITEYARPKGVIGAVVPSTNPVATPANNIINAVKCGNAVIVAPSPKGNAACEVLLGYIHAEFDKIGVPRDLVQMVPAPSSRAKLQALMVAVDLLVVTGSQDNVRRGYESGTPALGVGAGNVSVIVDETADPTEAARKIAASKTFDNATSCSSENSLVIVDAAWDATLAALHDNGGRHLTGDAAATLKTALFGGGELNRHMLAQDIDKVISVAGITVEDAATARFLLVDGDGIGPDYPESREKLSLVTTLYRAKDFEDAKAIAGRILANQGAGHSVGIHTADDARARELGATLPTCRVIVNQAHCFATGGSFDNGMPFSLSMGCGSWGGNSIDDNLNYRHFMNITKVVRTIPANEPSVEEIFDPYWKSAGK